MAHIGPAVRERRKRAGLSLQKLAGLADVDPGHLSRVEREQAEYSAATEERLARALGISVAALHAGDVSAAGISSRPVPLIELADAADGIEAPPQFREEALRSAVPSELDLSRWSFAFRVRDNMMGPTFLEGDLVLVDPAVPPLAGDFVVARNGTGEVVFNRFRIAGSDPVSGLPIYELVPANPYFPTWRSDQHALGILGVMMEHRVPRRRN